MNLRANFLNLLEWTASFGNNFNLWSLSSEAFWPKDRQSATGWDFSPQAGTSYRNLLLNFIAPISPVLTYQNLVAMVSIWQVEIGSIFHKGESQTTLIYWSAPHGRLSNSTINNLLPKAYSLIRTLRAIMLVRIAAYDKFYCSPNYCSPWKNILLPKQTFTKKMSLTLRR